MILSAELRAEFDRLLLAIELAETGPSDPDLATAPLIDMWRPLMANQFCVSLWGFVTDHPELGRDYTTTSALIALDQQRGWARTWNRWYRLGTPLAELPLSAPEVRFTDFALPGFRVMDDEARLPEVLADYIVQVRKVDAQDRLARYATQSGDDLDV